MRTLKAANQGKTPTGGVTVWLRGGRYELTEPFVLGPEDSGQFNAPVVFRAYAKEQPVLSGGRVIRGWKQIEGDLPGLPAAAKGKVWVASAGGQRWQVAISSTMGRWQTFTAGPVAESCREAADRPGDRGKKPEADGYMHAELVPGEMWLLVLDGLQPPVEAAKDPAALNQWRQKVRQAWKTIRFPPEEMKVFPGDKLPNDLSSGQAELFCLNVGKWNTMRIPIGKVEGSQLTTAVPAGCLSYYWGAMRLMAGSMGHVENALSLLDQPGEWFLDRKSGLVYYMPAAGENPNTRQFIAPKLEQIVCLRGTVQAPVQFVELRGLRIEHAEWPMPAFGYRPILGGVHGTEETPLFAHPSSPFGDVPFKPGTVRPKDEYPGILPSSAVDLTYAWECRCELCRVGHVGATGIGLGEGCRRNRIVGCEVFDAGGNGIHAGMAHGPICGEDFDWKCREDEPQANEIASCYVHHNGEMDWGTYGIMSSYCRGNRIVHNLVEQQPYSGIAACFTWLTFPSGRDEEVTVEYNHIHHVLQKLFDGGGIYTKDGVSAASTLRGNLIHDVGGDSFANNGFFLDD